VSELLEADRISVSYGKIEAVRDVSLRLTAGQIVTVIGPNGAGKSSLLKALIGALPYGGSVVFGGANADRKTLEDRVDAGLFLVPEERALFAELTVEENLALGTFSRRRDGAVVLAQARDEIYALFPRLKERHRQLAGTLSGGERQMLALGRALIGKPRLLMLDEPSLGLAPRIVRDIFRTIVTLGESGVSLLVVEQNARAAIQIADYCYVMEQGRIALHGSPEDLESDERIIASYLGGDSAN
jgi:branched-chain amino acid transport system ATP-binding protein